MYKNFFFLNRFLIEANEILNGFYVESIFSQEKDLLIIQLSNQIVRKFVSISVNPGFPYITILDNYNRAKKNSINIFPSIQNESLSSIEIAKYDRIIKFKLESASLYFTIRGKHTNAIYINRQGDIESFKKEEDEFLKSFILEIKSFTFTPFFSIPEFENINDENFFEEIKRYSFVGKEILNELKLRTDKNFLEGLIKILKEIEEEEPAVHFNETGDIFLTVRTFHNFLAGEVKEFSSLIDSLNFYISKRYFLEETQRKRKKIQKFLDSELQKVTSRLNSIRSRIDKGSKEEEYAKIGNLLLINLHKIKKGMEKIELQNIYDRENPSPLVQIKLKENLSPKKNVDFYFEQSKGERIGFSKSKELYSKLYREYQKLKLFEDKLNIAKNIKDYNSIMDEMNLKERNLNPGKEDLSEKFKQYLIERKYKVYVGKDSKNNDLLTTKFAKQNDYWFHARSVPGSHVVLRVENSKEPVPKNILKKTASLAAYHSKAKTAGTVPVSYTLKKYVVKKKGMEPGKVALMREETLLVKPEIPDSCEYIDKD